MHSNPFRDGITKKRTTASSQNETRYKNHCGRLLKLARDRSFGSEDHAKVAEVAVAHGEEDHEHDVVGVAVEDDGEMSLAWCRVAVHEKRDEHDP